MSRPGESHSDQPFVIPADQLPSAEAASPADAPPPPDEAADGAAMLAVTRLATRRRGSGLAGWFWSLAVGLLGLMVSVAAYDWLTRMLERFPPLGFAALVLTVLLALIVLVQLLREALAFRRLARIDSFRRDAAGALASADRAAAIALSERLERFYAARPEIAWGARGLQEQREATLDADAVIALTERKLFQPLDQQARREIEAAARTVAGATALLPLALIDVLTALSMNLRMIRRIADTYGAHAGFFGSWRLLRSVATHLLATGAVAVGDDLVHSVAGGNILTRVSRRFGEGFINGALTARVGIAAMEVCRPLPFDALPRPRVSNILGRALTGLFPTSTS
jgi:putative membrane protein